MATDDERILSKKWKNTRRGRNDAGKNGRLELFLQRDDFPAQAPHSSNNTTLLLPFILLLVVLLQLIKKKIENRGLCFPECHVFLWGLIKPGSLSQSKELRF